MAIVGGFNRPKIGVEVDFGLSKWVLNAGQYQMDIQHNLETEKVTVEFWENDKTKIDLGQVEIYNTNTIRVKVPFDPDCRVIGKAIIIQI